MNVLIIGNGFDLAHGLKTSYMDFLQLCLLAKSENVKWNNEEFVIAERIKKQEKFLNVF
ncbi:MAG: hypothetical protein IJ655_06160 [Lachnospiraceae bacterium]|nr:hypothetical protein [Lachnospiraceae bacterium]